jgi:hypothetical protein
VEVTKGRVLAARVIAVLADAVQLGLMPLFAGGAVTGFDTVLDVAVGVAMVALLGWHWAFLPTFAVELLPAVDLAPTWTIAVFFVTRKMGGVIIDATVVPPEPPRLPPAGR